LGRIEHLRGYIGIKSSYGGPDKMKLIIGTGIIAGLSLIVGLSATGQTPSTTANKASTLTTTPSKTSSDTQYQYDFISKRYVWSNKPLRTTAGKICKVMRDRTFAESPYAINGDQDWNNCLDTQIRSIGYMRWLQNDGFKPTRKNRRNAQDYLKKNYTMGPYGSYTFAQLHDAVTATGGMQKK
jgi:hypothetical protein